MTPKTVFILSITSDIGSYLANRFLEEGHRVIGTYRTDPKGLPGDKSLTLIHCDLDRSEAIGELAQEVQKRGVNWDVFISAVGVLNPIKPFFDCDFNAWNHSTQLNSSSQLHALHALHPFRSPKQLCHVIFFAGGGSNGPFPRYSAYCAGKILLTKMCELLANENPDLNVFISGTGWVRTKIHQATLDAKSDAGKNYHTTKTFLDDKDEGTPLERIYQHIIWGINVGPQTTSGRNFSIVHDNWESQDDPLSRLLGKDQELFKLRRYGNNEASVRSPSRAKCK